MPAEKRPSYTENGEAPSASQPKLRRHDVVKEGQAVDGGESQSYRQSLTPPEQQKQLKQEAEKKHDVVAEEDSDASDTEEPQEFAYVDLQTIRKEVQCPICLGIIKKTRTVMECLHRFCRECIDKSMRMGNNECPACRTHCASRRSLRDDPRYDAVIAALYPDIKKFEEEELAFCEEDETRNKQIQESIAQVLRKQSDVLGKRRHANKDTASPSTARNHGNAHSRRRRRKRNASPEYQDSDDNNDANDSDTHFDGDEHHTEIKQRKGKTRASIGSSHSPSATSLENNVEESKEGKVFSPGLTCSTEMLAWGKGGVRSSSRNSNANGCMSRNARRIRLAKLVNFLHNLEDNDEELNIHLMLISLDKQMTSLQRPYLCCQPSLSIRHLCEYVALQTSLPAENVQVVGIRDRNVSSDHDESTPPHPSSSSNKKKMLSHAVDPPLQDRLHILDSQGTLSGVVTNCVSNGEQLILAYQQREAM